MTQLNLSIQEPTIQIINGKATTTSLEIAKFFDKEHSKVIRSIQTLLKQEPEWGIANFGETPYLDQQNGQEYIYYTITRDGFVMLAMSYTGDKARKIKLTYIQAFNAMEAELSGKPLQLDAPSTKEDRKPLTNLVGTLVDCAPFSFRNAWHMVHAHMGGKPAEEFTLAELPVAMAFVQEQINLHTAKDATPDRPDIITEQAMKGVKAFIARISIEEPTQDAKVKLVNKQFRATVYISEEKPPSECMMNIEYMLSQHHKK